MFALIALAFIVLPLVEIYVLIQVGHVIGALNTIGLVLLVSIVGAWLTKHEGLWVLTRLREQLNAGRMPTNEIVDGALILAGGMLLIVPGFVTDAFGLLLLLPPTRVVARSLVKRRFQVRVYGLPGGRRPPPDDVIDV